MTGSNRTLNTYRSLKISASVSIQFDYFFHTEVLIKNKQRFVDVLLNIIKTIMLISVCFLWALDPWLFNISLCNHLSDSLYELLSSDLQSCTLNINDPDKHSFTVLL